MRGMEAAWLVFMASIRLTFQRIGLLLVTNSLWWLLSLPLLTWPPATAGLYHVARRLTRPEEAEETTWRHFFDGFRQYWLRSWQLMGLNLLLGGVIVVSFLFYLAREQLALRLVAAPVFYILLLWLGMQLYLFPLLIEQQQKDIRLVFKNAFILALGNVTFTLVLGLLLLSVILVSSTLTGPVLLILISFLAVAQTLGLQHLLQVQYQKENEQPTEEL
jgi:uncharacterized membrane protein YesL